MRRERGHELDSAWLSLLYLLLGDHLGEQAQVIPLQSRATLTDDHRSSRFESWDDLLGKVRGVVASRRKKGDRLSVWVGDARKLGAVVDVGRMVSCSLLPTLDCDNYNPGWCRNIHFELNKTTLKSHR